MFYKQELTRLRFFTSFRIFLFSEMTDHLYDCLSTNFDLDFMTPDVPSSGMIFQKH